MGMNKYKVEVVEYITQKYIIDVLAESEAEATDKAGEEWGRLCANGTYHYHESEPSETDTHIGAVFDVTNTDDPFDPFNEPEK